MTKEQIKAILLKYESGTCTKNEKALLETWFLRQQAENLPAPDEMEDDLNEVWFALSKKVQPRTRVLTLPRIAAAASIILCLSVGGYFMLHKQQSPQIASQGDITPGQKQAVLTLGNGQKIILTGNGLIAHQLGKAITFNTRGQVNYADHNKADGSPSELIYNTLTTPSGNQQDIILSDGTEVSLDAGSSITFPVVFDKNERSVSVTGQVYFKVKHNAKWPFTIKVKDMTVRDIGTEFNINSYDDEPAIKTTLIEGSIKLSKGNQQAVLKPGEEAVASINASGIIISKVDVEPVIAWKKGDFIFQDEDFKTAMRQIARWYDVEIVYDASASVNIMPGGWISRSKNLSVVLKTMALTGNVHFKVEGRRVIVTK